MKKLPDNLSAYKRTPVFCENSIPKGLLKSHSTREGTWGKIIVEEGRLLYRILEPQIEEVKLSSKQYGVVEPQILHEVKPLGKVKFYVEFLK